MKLLVLFCGVAVGVATSGCYTNPVTGRKSMVLISQQQELAIGAQSFADTRGKEKISAAPAEIDRVRRVGERIAKAVGEQMPDAKWEFVVFDSPAVNAFALPGGKVGVYSGLLRLAESDAELAIVMGHEIGHVIARHGAERMSEAMAIEGFGAIAATVAEGKYDGQTVGMFKQFYGLGTTIGILLPHSRGNESEADRMGLIYAARAGYDPRAAIGFWKKMAAQSAAGGGAKPPPWMSTHPADEKRIADLGAAMPQVTPIYEANRGKFP
ncbi:MAG: hypothetical protein RLZZ15_3066 [Verrucomicrobiota bacterium]|jgi:predicted Zn-dependent protease